MNTDKNPSSTKSYFHHYDTDVLVVGSGSAGATAAIAAALQGARTLLVERYGFMGGISTQVLDTFYGFYTPGATARKVVGGIPDRVVAELDRRGAKADAIMLDNDARPERVVVRMR